jgi:hypothetical protein
VASLAWRTARIKRRPSGGRGRATATRAQILHQIAVQLTIVEREEFNTDLVGSGHDAAWQAEERRQARPGCPARSCCSGTKAPTWLKEPRPAYWSARKTVTTVRPGRGQLRQGRHAFAIDDHPLHLPQADRGLEAFDDLGQPDGQVQVATVVVTSKGWPAASWLPDWDHTKRRQFRGARATRRVCLRWVDAMT